MGSARVTEDQLRDILTRLSESVSARPPSSASLQSASSLNASVDTWADPLALVESLGAICLGRNFSEEERSICASMLFRSEHINALEFLKRSGTQRVGITKPDAKVVAARAKILVVLTEFVRGMLKGQGPSGSTSSVRSVKSGTGSVQNVSGDVGAFASLTTVARDLLECVFEQFKRDSSNVVKINCLKLLRVLVRHGYNPTASGENSTGLTLFASVEALNGLDMAEALKAEYKFGKSTATVKSEMLQMLAVLCVAFPEDLGKDNSVQVMHLVMDALQKQFRAQKQEPSMIAGCFKALASLLYRFSEMLSSDPRQLGFVYKLASVSIELPRTRQAKYDLPKAALKLLKTHGSTVFAQYLTEDHQVVFRRLVELCSHTNKKLNVAAFSTLEAFLETIATEITAGNRSHVSDQETFKFFLKTFYDYLESPAPSMRDISVAIRGLGVFAQPILQFMGPHQLRIISSKLFEFAEQLFAGIDEAGSVSDTSLFEVQDVHRHLPSLLNAFAAIIGTLDELDETDMNHMERAVAGLFKVFPDLYPSQRLTFCRSLSRLFIALHSHGGGVALRSLMQRVSFAAVSLTVSRRSDRMSEDAYGVASAQRPLWVDYQWLWKHMLDISRLPIGSYAYGAYRLQAANAWTKDPAAISSIVLAERINKTGVVPTELADAVALIVYDSLVESALAVIRKLDLTYSQSSSTSNSEQAGNAPSKRLNTPASMEGATYIMQEQIAAEAEAANAATDEIVASKPQDHDLFLNLVSFCRAVFPRRSALFCARWGYVFIRDMISYITELPLVSGFYRLATLALRMCDYEGYFLLPQKSSTDSASFTTSAASSESSLPRSGSLLESSGMTLRAPDQDRRLENARATHDLYASIASQGSGEVDLLTQDGFASQELFFGQESNVVTSLHFVSQQSTDLATQGTRQAPSRGLQRQLNERFAARELVCKFARELVIRQRQFTDELMAAATQLLLSLPTALLVSVTFGGPAILAGAVREALIRGISVPSLAQGALIALESWRQQIPFTMLHSFWPAILPFLDPYLSFRAPTSVEAGEDRSFSDAGKILDVQKKVLCLLGRLGGVAQKVVVDEVALLEIADAHESNSTDTASTKTLSTGHLFEGVAWGPTIQLQLHVPLPEKGLDVELRLDPLLPRIATLALHSNTLEVKIAACECLHACVLVMVDRSQTDAKAFQSYWKHVLPTLLRLAVDPNGIAKQLFGPLVLQLIHWLALPDNSLLLGVAIDAVFQGCGDSKDGALREFCASTCVPEILKSCIRQKKRPEEHVKKVFLRLFALSKHPSPYQRLGCALALFAIVDVFEDYENVLIKPFAVDTVRNALDCLVLCDRQHESDRPEGKALATGAMLGVVLRRLGRLIVQTPSRVNTLLESSSLRDFLRDIAAHYLSAREIRARHSAQDLLLMIGERAAFGLLHSFSAGDVRLSADAQECLAAFERGIDSSFLRWKLLSFWLLRIFEMVASDAPDAGALRAVFLQQLPQAPVDLSVVAENGSCAPVIIWMGSLTAGIDSLAWGMRRQLISLDALCMLDIHEQSLPALVRDCVHFLDVFALPMQGMQNSNGRLVDERSLPEFASVTPADISAYRLAKHNCIRTLISFAGWLGGLAALTSADGAAEYLRLMNPNDAIDISMRAMQTTSVLADATRARFILVELFDSGRGDSLFRVLFSALLSPQLVGARTADEESAELKALREDVRRAVRNLTKFLAQMQKGKCEDRAVVKRCRQAQHHLTAALRSALSEPPTNLVQLVSEYAAEQFEVTSGVETVRGYRVLNRLALLTRNLPNSMTAVECGNIALTFVFDKAGDFTPSELFFGKELLEFALDLARSSPELVANVIHCLLDETNLEIVPVSNFSVATENGAEMGSLAIGRALAASGASVEQSPDTSLSAPTSSTDKLTKGRMFFEKFQGILVDFCMRHFTTIGKQLFSALHTGSSFAYRLLCSLMDVQVRHRRVGDGPSAQQEAFARSLAPYLGHLQPWISPESSTVAQREAALRLVLRVVALAGADAHMLQDGMLMIRGTFDALMDRAVPLALKTAALDLIPLFQQHAFISEVSNASLSLDSDQQVRVAAMSALDQRVAKSIESILVYDFPTKVSDASELDSAYASCVAKLFELLATTRNLPLLEILFPLLKEENHVLSGVMANSLDRFVGISSSTGVLTDSMRSSMFEFAWDHFQRQDYPDGLRRVLCFQICIPLLRGFKEMAALSQLCSRHISQWMGIVAPNAPLYSSATHGAQAADNQDVQSYLWETACVWQLLHSTFDCVSTEVITKDLSPAYTSEEKGLLRMVMRRAHDVKKETWASCDATSAYFRASFCCLIAIVRKTQEDPKFFTTFIFNEDRSKHEVFWDHISHLGALNPDEPLFTVYTRFSQTASEKIKYQASHRKGQIKDSSTGFAQRTSRVSLSSTLPPVLAAASIDVDFETASPGFQQVRNPSSRYLAETSLSQDVAHMAAFFGEAAAAASAYAQRSENASANPSVNPVDAAGSAAQSLELDILNANPVMSAFLGAVDTIVSLTPKDKSQPNGKAEIDSYSSWVQAHSKWERVCIENAHRLDSGDDVVDPPEPLRPPTPPNLPPWMASMLKIFSAQSTRSTTRLFFLKVVLNRPHIFAPWRVHWLNSILECSLSDMPSVPFNSNISASRGSDVTMQDDKSIPLSKGFHYMLRDVCTLLCEWNLVPEDEALASKFVNTLVYLSPHDTSSVQEVNLSLVKMLARQWNDSIFLSKSLLANFLQHDGGAGAESTGPVPASINPQVSSTSHAYRRAGIMILSVLVQLGFPLYDPNRDRDVSEGKLARALVENINHPRSDIWRAAAQLIGAALRHDFKVILPNQSVSNRNVLQEELTSWCEERLRSFAYNSFLQVLREVGDEQTGCPAFLPQFRSRLFGLLPSPTLPGDARPAALDILACDLSQNESTPSAGVEPNFDNWRRFQPVLRSSIDHRDDSVQLNALKLLMQLWTLRQIPVPEMTRYFEQIRKSFSNHRADSCRRIFFQLLLVMHRDTKDFAAELRGQVLQSLLVAIGDPDPSLREHILQYWNTEILSGLNPEARLKQLFTELYSPNRHAEAQWTRTGVELMILLSERSPQFDQRSERELLSKQQTAEFTDVDIDTTMAGSQTMEPLFSLGHSVRRQQRGGDRAGMRSNLSSFMLRATPRSGAPTTSMGTVPTIDPFSIAQSSLHPGHQRRIELLGMRSRDPRVDYMPASSYAGSLGPERDDPRHTINYAPPITGSVPLVHQTLQLRRFAGAAQSASSARENTFRMRRRQASERRQAAAKHERVTLYRRYRTGEVPDIRIAPRDILKPLSRISAGDASIARQVFELFFAELFPRFPIQGQREIGEQVHQILRRTEGTSSLVSTLLSLCAAHGSMLVQVPPGVIADVALRSQCPRPGAFAIETQLVLDVEDSSSEFKSHRVSLMKINHVTSGARNGGKQEKNSILSILENEWKAMKASGKSSVVGAKRKDPESEPMRRELWSNLSRLYEDMSKLDALRSVVEREIASHPWTRQALAAEVSGDFVHAYQLYLQGCLALEDQNYDWTKTGASRPRFDAEIDRWDDGRIRCLMKLGQWDGVVELILTETASESNNVPDPTRLWQIPSSWRQNLSIQRFLIAVGKVAPSNPSRLKLLSSFETSTTPYQREKLKQLAPSTMTLLPLLSRQAADTDLARAALRDWQSQFSVRWSQLHALDSSGRRRMLAETQQMMEIDEFFSVSDHLALSVSVVRNWYDAQDSRKYHVLPVEPMMGLAPSETGSDEANADSEWVRFGDGIDTVAQSLRAPSPIGALLFPLRSVLASWACRFPDPRYDEIEHWDDIITTRAALMQALYSKVENAFGDIFSANLSLFPGQDIVVDSGEVRRSLLREVKDALVHERSKAYAAMSDAARKQNQLKVAQDKWRLATQNKKHEFSFPLFYSTVRLNQARAARKTGLNEKNPIGGNVGPQVTEEEFVEGVDMIARAIEYADKKRHEPDIELSSDRTRKFCLLQANSFAMLAALAQGSQSDAVESVLRDKSADILKHHGQARLADGLTAQAAELFHSAANSYLLTQADVSEVSRSSTYLKYGSFCDAILRQREKASHAGLPNIAILPKSLETDVLVDAVVRNCLLAMKAGLRRAGDALPRVLDLLGKYGVVAVRPFTAVALNAEANSGTSLPLALVKRWVGQLTAELNVEPQATCVLPLLRSLCRVSPVSVFYPLNMSAGDAIRVEETVNFLGNTWRDEGISDHVRRLWIELASNSVVKSASELIAQLELFTNAEMRFMDSISEVSGLMKALAGELRSNNRHQNDPALQKKAFENACDRLTAFYQIFVVPIIRPAISQTAEKEHGALLFQKISENLVPLFESDIPNTPSCLHKLLECWRNEQIFSKRLSEWLRKVAGVDLRTKNAPKNVRDFSSKLQQLDLSGVPVPCYSGNAVSLRGPTIVGFADDVQTMPSLRKPKRLAIRGSDEVEYNVLVKGGEDLRQDERLEQLFSVANEILAANPETLKRNLRVYTYEVVPMSSHLGVLEWIDNTTSLLSVIKSEAALGHEGILEHAGTLWAGANVSGKQLQAWTMELLRSSDDEARRAHFSSVEQTIPPNLLQRGLYRRAGNAECFLTMRESFARSMAVQNIVGYLFGIGDRHMDNFLLHESSGFVIPIDFGYSFEVAKHLPVPELVPFRLTRQITYALSPLDSDYRQSSQDRLSSGRGSASSGLLKLTMVHTLAALRARADVLMSAMDVFIIEPIEDWKKSSKRVLLPDVDAGSSEQHKLVSYARSRINMVERKLRGDNPARILADDIGTSLLPADTIKQIKRVALGDKANSIRANIGNECANVREQVDALVDLATDTSVLGRAWAGWKPFL